MQEDKLKGFKKYGFIVNSNTPTQAIGDCVFCGKENKMYVNKGNGMWDCKVCMKKGGYRTFLEHMQAASLKLITQTDLAKLSANRGVPVSAFANYKIGKNGNDYVLPVYDHEGKLQDLRTFRFGNKLMSSPGCQVSLLGLEKLAKAEKSSLVYLCEGEWDAMALAWLLKALKKPGIVLGTPGAGTFKKEWIPSFQDKHVVVLYDNDKAGELGEKVVYERLNGAAASLKFMHWPKGRPDGFDIRDLIVQEAINKKVPRGSFAYIERNLQPKPRRGVSDASEEEEKIVPTYEIKDRTVTLEKVFRVFEKWLHKPNRDAIELSIATIISNELQGDPLWLFMVAPPGGSKTEILSSFDKCTNTFITSSLTPHALISGTALKSGRDPSLIPKLNGKTLIVKDFTSILGKRETEKDEIFGILRDAYDGKSGKVFGTGVTRYYKSHFSILSAVTPVIYELSGQYAGLGERFLKFFLGSSMEHVGEKDIIRRSMRNVNKETSMRDELADVVRDFVHIKLEQMRKPGYKMPVLPESKEDQIIACAQFVARVRASVPRDKFDREIISSRPSVEVGSRLGKQLTRVALTITVVNGRSSVDDHAIRILKKITLDTVSQRNEEILRVIFKGCQTEDDMMLTKDVAMESRYPFSTVSRVLNDMHVMGIVDKSETSKKSNWRLSKYMLGLIKESTLYTLDAEINRPKIKVGIVLKVKPKAKPIQRSDDVKLKI